MVRAFIVLSLAITFYFALEAKAQEDCTTSFKGCNIVGQQCECGTQTACQNPWMFRNANSCRKATFADSCKKHVCLNKGVCVQLKEGPKCKCAGTGYYGDACEIQCPATEEVKQMDSLPPVCVYP